MILIVGIQELGELMMWINTKMGESQGGKNKQAIERIERNGVLEYRKTHPKCIYCKYSCDTGDFAATNFYCKVRRKEYIFSRAKYCSLYEVDTKI